MKTVKLYGTDTETYNVNPNQINYFYTAVISKKTVIRLSCGKEIETNLTCEKIKELLNEQ